jgi:hypothetical protein
MYVYSQSMMSSSWLFAIMVVVTVSMSHVHAHPIMLRAPHDPLPNRFRAETGTFSVSWGYPSSDTIEVEFSAAGNGWIGMAFGGSMFKSDMIIGYVAANGTAVVRAPLSMPCSHHDQLTDDVMLYPPHYRLVIIGRLNMKHPRVMSA